MAVKHTCHAQGCEKEIPPRLLMCLKHWRMVPLTLQAEVWRWYRPGQEVDKGPGYLYLVAMKNAINAVARLEGQTLLSEVPRLEEEG
jgi:hypothetical protein